MHRADQGDRWIAASYCPDEIAGIASRSLHVSPEAAEGHRGANGRVSGLGELAEVGGVDRPAVLAPGALGSELTRDGFNVCPDL
jgi:hypothetical protein